METIILKELKIGMIFSLNDEAYVCTGRTKGKSVECVESNAPVMKHNLQYFNGETLVVDEGAYRFLVVE